MVSSTAVSRFIALSLLSLLVSLLTACGGGGGGGSTAPTITSFAPTTATVGTTVTITGTNFDTTTSGNTVKFNGVAGTVTSATKTELKATVPPGATSGPISVETSAGQATSATSLTVTAAGAAPTITSVNPSNATVGSTVTITGTNFDPIPANNAVTFNGKPGVVTSATTTELKAIVPTGATSGKVTVTTAGGTVTSTTDLGITSLGSSATSSGSTAIFTKDGATVSLTPSGAGGGVKLVSFPNSGISVAVVTVTQVTVEGITTSLPHVDGVSVDPASNVGVAFGFLDGRISIFNTATKTEITTYDTQTTQTMGFSGASRVKISGIIMDVSRKQILIASADGYEIVDYSNPANPNKVREIPSKFIDAANGVGIAENFGYHPGVTIGGVQYRLILTGEYSSSSNHFELVDVDSGKIYKPDSPADLLFSGADIDSIAVDSTYHVALLADEGQGTYFVDLTKLTLDSGAGKFAIPPTAFRKITTYTKMDNLGIESSTHLVMMGRGFGGTDVVVAKLQDPSIALGFVREALLPMPSATDDKGTQVSWFGGQDPHTAGAFLTDGLHPSAPNAALGFWVSSDQKHIATINLQKVLDGKLANPNGYDPTASTPRDIGYFFIP